MLAVGVNRGQTDKERQVVSTFLLILVIALLFVLHAVVGPPEGDEGPEEKD